MSAIPAMLRAGSGVVDVPAGHPAVSGPARPALAVVPWAVVVAAVVLADAQHALSATWLGAAAVGAASLGLGLLAGWWALAALVLLVPLAALEGGRGDAVLLLVFGGPAVGLVLLVGAGAGAGLRRRRRERGAPGAALLAVAVLTVAGAALAERRVVDRRPAQPRFVDPAAGTFGPVSLGARVRDLRLGRLERVEGRLDPPGESLSGPSSFRGDVRVLARPRLAVFSARGRVAGFVTSDPSAELRGGEGIGVGDSIELVPERLDGFECDGIALGDSREPLYEACSRRLASGATLWLGGDPIDSIWLYRDDAG